MEGLFYSTTDKEFRHNADLHSQVWRAVPTIVQMKAKEHLYAKNFDMSDVTTNKTGHVFGMSFP